MRQIHKPENAPLFVPDFVASSLFDIDYRLLHKQGIKYVAFDADSTLVGYRHKVMPEELKLFLRKELKVFSGVCIASNRITNDLDEIAKSIDAQTIRASLRIRKPSSGFFDRVIDLFKAKPKQIAMIGDKLIADIYGGNKSGMTTIWVNKNGKDSIFDRILQTRRFEKYMTRRHIDK